MFYRITGRQVWKGPQGSWISHPPCHKAGPPTSPVNTRPGCPGPHSVHLEHLKGWDIHNLCGQPVPAPHHSHSKELPLDIQPKSPLLQIKTISPCPAITYPFKDLTPLLSSANLLRVHSVPQEFLAEHGLNRENRPLHHRYQQNYCILRSCFNYVP